MYKNYFSISSQLMQKKSACVKGPWYVLLTDLYIGFDIINVKKQHCASIKKTISLKKKSPLMDICKGLQSSFIATPLW